MAAYTFAALFLAHVLADYVLQTTWMVVNKDRAIAMAAHIGLVLGTLCLTTLTLNPWFIAVAIAHLWIDVVKTYAMPKGLGAYIADQLLHVASLAAIALLAPALWNQSPLAEVPHIPLIYMITGGVLFAMRGGQYAVAMLLPADGQSSTRGIFVGWAERAALCIVLIGGFPMLTAGVLAAKGVYLGTIVGSRSPDARKRAYLGTAISIGWGLAVAIPLALVMPMMH